jgi:hypothetical protein
MEFILRSFPTKQEQALSRREKKILDPFFLEGSRQLERFSARMLF